MTIPWSIARHTELNELILEEGVLHLGAALWSEVAKELLELARALG